MASLLDQIKKAQNQQPGAVAPQQQAVTNVLKAKTGKAGPSAGPGASSVGEDTQIRAAQSQGAGIALQGQQAAVNLGAQADAVAAEGQIGNAALDSEARQAGANLATTNAVTREQLGAKADMAQTQTAASEGMRLREINNAADNKLKELASDRGVIADEIWASFEASNKTLASRRDIAEIEQAGHLLRIKDQAYMDELDRIGRERNLLDEVAWREETTRIGLGRDMSNVLKDLDFQMNYNSTDRINKRELAKIDINAAIRLSEAAIADGNRRAIAEGGISVVKTGADAWAKSEKEDKPASTTTKKAP